MKNISLLPAELKSYKKSAKKFGKIAMALSAAIMAFVLVYAMLSLALLIHDRELDSVRGQRAEIQLMTAELEPYKDMADKTSAVEDLVEKAMGNNPDWGSLLVEIFNTIPNNVWLNDFSAQYSGNAGEITIRGWATAHGGVADWLNELDGIEGLRNVMCLSSVISGEDSGSAVQFEIKAELTGSKRHEIPVEGGGK